MSRAKATLESVPAAAGGRSSKSPRRGKQTARRVLQRKYVQTISGFDLWSVLKVAVCFYLCALVVLLTAGALLWTLLSTVGVIGNAESFVGDLVNNDEFSFLSWGVLRAATLIGVVMVCILTVLTVLGAAFYNLFAQAIGGIEVRVVEQEDVAG